MVSCSTRCMAALVGVAALLHLSSPVLGQISTYPFVETFDAVLPPGLPPGWSSSQHRNAGSNDFTLAATLSHSQPNAVLSTNASIEQWLISPVFDFSNVLADTMTFYTRRSSTHRAIMVVEASLDGGRTFSLQIGDSLTNAGTASYLLTSFPLPPVLSGKHDVTFRWRLVPEQGGGTATLRIDDVRVTVVNSCDLELLQLSAFPPFPRAGDSVEADALVRNVGLVHAQGFSVEFFADANRDSIPQAVEQRASVVSTLPLAVGDSLGVTARLGGFSAGDHLLICRVVFEGDQDTGNNLLRMSLVVGYSRNSVVVNEIMFAPLATGAEYVELMNVSQGVVDLSGWTVADRSSTGSGGARTPLANGSRLLYQGELLVLASDSSLFEFFHYLREVEPRLVIIGGGARLHLNNDGDDVVLRDVTGSIIDSVAYLPSWHNPGVDDPTGRSLEKILSRGYSNDPRNWSSCAASVGGTPAKANSINAPSVPITGARLTVYPNPFSPDGDGIEDFAVIRYCLPLPVAMLSVRIFDARGRLIRYLANSEPTGAEGEIVWDGCDEDGRKARIGPYVVFLEALNGQPGTIETARAIVVLAAQL